MIERNAKAIMIERLPNEKAVMIMIEFMRSYTQPSKNMNG